MKIPAGATLKKREILRGGKDLQNVFEKGEKCVYGSVVMFYFLYSLKNISPPFRVRAGFSAPRKNMPRAVDRNRIKRLLKESYRVNKKLLTDAFEKSLFGLDIMIVYRGEINGCSRYVGMKDISPDLKKCIEILIERLGKKDSKE